MSFYPIKINFIILIGSIEKIFIRFRLGAVSIAKCIWKIVPRCRQFQKLRSSLLTFYKRLVYCPYSAPHFPEDQPGQYNARARETRFQKHEIRDTSMLVFRIGIPTHVLSKLSYFLYSMQSANFLTPGKCQTYQSIRYQNSESFVKEYKRHPGGKEGQAL